MGLSWPAATVGDLVDLANVISLALADATAKLRADRPDWFVKVDEIKAEPGWEPFASMAKVGKRIYKPAPSGVGFFSFRDA